MGVINSIKLREYLEKYQVDEYYIASILKHGYTNSPSFCVETPIRVCVDCHKWEHCSGIDDLISDCSTAIGQKLYFKDKNYTQEVT